MLPPKILLRFEGLLVKYGNYLGRVAESGFLEERHQVFDRLSQLHIEMAKSFFRQLRIVMVTIRM